MEEVDEKNQKEKDLARFLFLRLIGFKHDFDFLKTQPSSLSDRLFAGGAPVLRFFTLFFLVIGCPGAILGLLVSLKKSLGWTIYLPFEIFLSQYFWLPMVVCLVSLLFSLTYKMFTFKIKQRQDDKMSLCRQAAKEILDGAAPLASLKQVGLQNPHDVMFAFHVKQCNLQEIKKLKGFVDNSVAMDVFCRSTLVSFGFEHSPDAAEMIKEIWSWFSDDQKIKVRMPGPRHARLENKVHPVIQDFLIEARCIEDKQAIEKTLPPLASGADVVRKIRKM